MVWIYKLLDADLNFFMHFNGSVLMLIYVTQEEIEREDEQFVKVMIIVYISWVLTMCPLLTTLNRLTHFIPTITLNVSTSFDSII